MANHTQLDVCRAGRWRPIRILVACAVLLASHVAARARVQGAMPSGFSEVKIADALNSPTAMAVAPDGRIFVAHQGGAIRIIKNDVLLPTPFYSVPTAAYDEQGLSGITFDPNFASNGYVYVVYSPSDGNDQSHQRLARITANGDVALAGSEVTLFELAQSRIAFHLGGALQFGSDGKLYMTTGEGVSDDVQSNTNFAGKVLRLNANGSVPNDNPYCTNTSQQVCAIWAKGFRNPFVMNAQPGTGRIYINDVGGGEWEEINEAGPSRNFGYPDNEGANVLAGQTAPLYTYPHSQGCAIVGGAFYNVTQFPAAYQGAYFFADYCQGWIRYLNPSAPGNAQTFGTATGIGLVSLAVGANGSLYYLARGSTSIDGGTGAGFDTGSVYKISYNGSQTPYFIGQPQSQTRTVGQTATFNAEAGGGQPLFYQWQKNGSNIAGANSASYTTPNLVIGDNGAQYRVVVTNTSGKITSTAASLTVTSNQPPSAAITQPSAGSTYANGQVLAFAGTASDPETTLQASAYTWKIDLHHDAHVHPFMQPTSGITNGTITLPSEPHATSGVFYRVYLSVSDGQFSTTTTRDIYPNGKTRIVDWGGDYVTTDTAMQRFISTDTNVDLDGDGANDDARAYIPFNDAQPINPNPSGGNAYGGAYTQGTSWRFFGGLLLQHYNSDFATKYGEVWERPNGLDRIYYSADPVSDGWMTLYWKKADFLDGGSTDGVRFDANSSLELLTFAGSDGNVNDNIGRVRFVVKNGNQFYISQDFAENNVTSFTLSDPASKQWAAYNPSAPYGIKFNANTASFSTRTFNDITAVGVYHATDNSTFDSRRAGLNFERFRVYATVGTPATPPPATATSSPTQTRTPTLTHTPNPLRTPTPTHTPNPLHTATRTPLPSNTPTATMTPNPNVRPRLYLSQVVKP